MSAIARLFPPASVKSTSNVCCYEDTLFPPLQAVLYHESECCTVISGSTLRDKTKLPIWNEFPCPRYKLWLDGVFENRREIVDYNDSSVLGWIWFRALSLVFEACCALSGTRTCEKASSPNRNIFPHAPTRCAVLKTRFHTENATQSSYVKSERKGTSRSYGPTQGASKFRRRQVVGNLIGGKINSTSVLTKLPSHQYMYTILRFRGSRPTGWNWRLRRQIEGDHCTKLTLHLTNCCSRCSYCEFDKIILYTVRT